MANWLDRGVTYVSGSAPVGVYAADGTFNVVEADPSVFTGLYHPCGAYNVTVSTQTNPPVYAPNGSLYLPSNTPGALPSGFGAASLYHDYTTSKYYGAPAPSITRASGKTVFDTAGLLSTVASGALALSDRGLSIEESRTNLCLRSEEFTHASWTGGANWFTADTAISPDGTMDADTLTTSGLVNQTIYQTIAVTADTVYTYSEFVKLGTMLSSEFKIAFYDASNAAFIATDVAPSVTLNDTQWQRTIHTITTPAGCTSLRVYCFRSSAAVTASKTAFVWGAQLELGAFATSYMPTTSGAVTRAADVVTIPSPTSYVSLAQGGAFVEWTEDVGPVGLGRRLFVFGPDEANCIRVFIETNNRVVVQVRVGNVSQASLSPPNSVVAGQTYKIAARWGLNDAAAYMSPSLGADPTPDAVVAVPAGTPVFALGSTGGNGFLNGPLRRLALWQTGPTNAELQALVA